MGRNEAGREKSRDVKREPGKQDSETWPKGRPRRTEIVCVGECNHEMSKGNMKTEKHFS